MGIGYIIRAKKSDLQGWLPYRLPHA